MAGGRMEVQLRTWSTDPFPGKMGHCLMTSTSEGVRSDALKPHWHQGRGHRGLTPGAWGGRRAHKLPLKVGLADTPPALPPARPSSTQRGQEDQHPAWLCRHHPTGELKCTACFQGARWELSFLRGGTKAAGVEDGSFSLGIWLQLGWVLPKRFSVVSPPCSQASG